jgi:hypothetical protein
MEILEQLYQGLQSLLPTAAVIVIVVVVIYAVRAFYTRRYHEIPGQRFRSQMVIMILSFAGLLAIIMTLPIGDTRQGQLLSLIGILLSAAIALSSTTFVGNIMAGMMMRALRNFKPGDFIVPYRNPDRRPRPDNSSEPVSRDQPGQSGPPLGDYHIRRGFPRLRYTAYQN